MATTVWKEGLGGSWFDSKKWDGGVPDFKKDVEITVKNAGVLTFGGNKAEAADLHLGSYLGPGRVNFDLNGGRLTVDNAYVGGPAPGPIFNLRSFPAPAYHTLAYTVIRNGQLTVEQDSYVGRGSVLAFQIGNRTSQSNPYGQLVVSSGGQVEVGRTLLLGSDRYNSNGYVRTW